MRNDIETVIKAEMQRFEFETRLSHDESSPELEISTSERANNDSMDRIGENMSVGKSDWTGQPVDFRFERTNKKRDG
jgi:hypothetical protein